MLTSEDIIRQVIEDNGAICIDVHQHAPGFVASIEGTDLEIPGLTIRGALTALVVYLLHEGAKSWNTEDDGVDLDFETGLDLRPEELPDPLEGTSAGRHPDCVEGTTTMIAVAKMREAGRVLGIEAAEKFGLAPEDMVEGDGTVSVIAPPRELHRAADGLHHRTCATFQPRHYRDAAPDCDCGGPFPKEPCPIDEECQWDPDCPHVVPDEAELDDTDAEETRGHDKRCLFLFTRGDEPCDCGP